EWDLAIRQLDLEVGGHVARSHKHRDLAQRRAVLVKFKDTIDDEARLLLLVTRRDEPRRFASGALRPEILGVSFRGARDECIRNVEDRLRRAIVLLERDDLRVGKLAREVENVSKARAAERVHALRV